ncbi:hypothetical protein SAMN05444673_6090 [Bacillus sp. OV166]|uniref:hypothetical protein n=1 Tax=Bacillus sp. OV166 TaxID=1882763 RepID=UPI000A2ADE7E|nr:hypothetical protein [Bacillus sp. OV166]SMQ84788.1 hypothetical protein SAMN05444673_6090 [Bacillus sp. OV166]
MNNSPQYFPYSNYAQQPDYHLQNSGYESVYTSRDTDDEVYRPDDAEDAPTTPPPAQMPALPATFSGAAQTGQMRSWMCNCLGKWGLIGLRMPGPFGRDFWFYPTEVRKNGVSGYTWRLGRRQKVSYRYSQIRNFMCFA